MDFRRILPGEVERVAEFAIRGLRPFRYPLYLDRDKVRATIDHFAHSTRDFHLAAFDGDELVGGIAVFVSSMPWFERSEAHVLMFFADRPGAGLPLLRAAMRWVDRQMGIRRVLWPLEDDANAERYARIARRYGFNRRQTVLLAYKE